MLNSTPQEILEKLKTFKKVIMTLHASPDGDSLGSSTAMKYFLEKHLQIEVDLVSGDTLPHYLNALPLSQEIKQNQDISDINIEKYDALINVDIATTGLMSTKLRRRYEKPNIFIINIDHHTTNEYYGDLNYINNNSSSAAEVLYDLFKEFNITFDNNLAYRLLIGMYSDTGALQFGYNKSSSILKKIASLIDAGIDPEIDIINPLFFNNSFLQKKFQGLVLNNLKRNEKYKTCYSMVSLSDWQNIGLNEENLSDAASVIQDLGECEFIFTLIERHDHFRGSFRSRKGVDVSLFAKELNGGGHKAAAGFALKKMPLEEAEKIVLDVIDRVGLKKYD